MRRCVPAIAVLLFTLGTHANAATITFINPPFEGTTALTTPGRQVVGNELFTPFNIATDVFQFERNIFGINQILFINNVASAIPATGVNVVVLETFDDDANLGTPFGAGNAANLIAAQITQTGPGFFIYFNSNLALPRLVYSTDLGDNTADLKILARITNLTAGALPQFTASNFALTTIPEPATLLLMTTGGALMASRRLRRKRTRE